MKTPLRVLLVGAAGRMGQAIARAAEGADDLEIVGRVDVGDRIEDAIGACDVVIDFSHPDATERNCQVCLTNGKPLVIGTTGHSAKQLLGPDFDVEIMETHHRLKKDAPSGTAKRLAEILSEARGLEYDQDVAH